MHQDGAVHCQRRTDRQDWDLLIGPHSPLGVEESRFFRMAGQRHAIPGCQEWTRGFYNAVARRIAAVHHPISSSRFGSTVAPPARQVADERHQPGKAATIGKREGDILAGDANDAPTAASCLIENGRCGSPVAGP